jgi:hypothetical protein
VIPTAASTTTSTSAMIAGAAEPWLAGALAALGCASSIVGRPDGVAAALAVWLRVGVAPAPAGVVSRAGAVVGCEETSE